MRPLIACLWGAVMSTVPEGGAGQHLHPVYSILCLRGHVSALAPLDALHPACALRASLRLTISDISRTGYSC